MRRRNLGSTKRHEMLVTSRRRQKAVQVVQRGICGSGTTWDYPIQFRGHDAAESALSPAVANKQSPKRCWTAKGPLSVEAHGDLERELDAS